MHSLKCFRHIVLVYIALFYVLGVPAVQQIREAFFLQSFEKSEKQDYSTQKPEELVRKIILASSDEGQVVLDPFCGSGTTPVCAEQLKRKWLACDLNTEYLNWTVERLEKVQDWPIDKWIKFDFDNQKRRNSIR